MLPVFRTLKAEFPEKQLITVAPPSRSHHRDLLAVADGHLVIKRSQIEKSLFGARVRSRGKIVAYRRHLTAPEANRARDCPRVARPRVQSPRMPNS